MKFEAPIARHEEKIIEEWTDYNGHMNVAYFTLIFDNATDVFYPLVGLGKPYRDGTGFSTFAVEAHIAYLREASMGDVVRVTTQLLGYDEKRLHYFHKMSHAEKGYDMATLEQLAVHVNLTERKVVPMPEKQLRLLGEMAAAHASLEMPKQAGRAVSMQRKK